MDTQSKDIVKKFDALQVALVGEEDGKAKSLPRRQSSTEEKQNSSVLMKKESSDSSDFDEKDVKIVELKAEIASLKRQITRVNSEKLALIQDNFVCTTVSKMWKNLSLVSLALPCSTYANYYKYVFEELLKIGAAPPAEDDSDYVHIDGKKCVPVDFLIEYVEPVGVNCKHAGFSGRTTVPLSWKVDNKPRTGVATVFALENRNPDGEPWAIPVNRNVSFAAFFKQFNLSSFESFELAQLYADFAQKHQTAGNVVYLVPSRDCDTTLADTANTIIDGYDGKEDSFEVWRRQRQSGISQTTTDDFFNLLAREDD
jgi:hypothetical protein